MNAANLRAAIDIAKKNLRTEAEAQHQNYVHCPVEACVVSKPCARCVERVALSDKLHAVADHLDDALGDDADEADRATADRASKAGDGRGGVE